MKTRSARRPPRRTVSSPAVQDISVARISDTELPAANAGLTAAPVSATHTDPSLLRRALYVWLGIVFAAVAWQPFVLGYYSDDWAYSVEMSQVGGPFSKLRWDYALFRADPTRPGLAPLRYVLSSLAGDHALLWHAALLLGNAILALTIVKLLRSILQPRDSLGRAITICAGSCWLLLPWNQAASYWPTMLPAVLVLAAEIFLLAYLIDGWRKDQPRAVTAGLLYLWICVSYEAFYFQWVALLLAGLAIWVEKRARLRTLFLSALALVAAQGGALWWWYSLSKRLYPTRHRPVPVNWREWLRLNYARVAPEIIRSMAELSSVVIVIAVVVVALCVFVYVRSFMRREEREARQKTALYFSACLLGAIISLVVYSAGGREVFGTGVDTRTLYIFNVWLIVAGAVLAAFAIERLNSVTGRVLAGALAALGVCLAFGQVLRAGEWATAARLQDELLDRAPLSELKRIEPGAAVLLVNPRDLNGAPIFSSFLDFTHALPWKYPYLPKVRVEVYNPWMGPMRWQNGVLSYQSEIEYRGRDLYVWRPIGGEFFKADAPFTVAEDLTIQRGGR